MLHPVLPRDATVDQTLTLIRCQNTAHHFDRGTFPCTIGADVAHHFAFLNGETNILQRMDRCGFSWNEGLCCGQETTFTLCDVERFTEMFYLDHLDSLTFFWQQRDKKSIRNRILATRWSKRTWLGQRLVSQTKVAIVYHSWKVNTIYSRKNAWSKAYLFKKGVWCTKKAKNYLFA